MWDELTAGDITNSMLFMWLGGDQSVQSVAYQGKGGIENIGQVGGPVNLARLDIGAGGHALSAGPLTCG